MRLLGITNFIEAVVINELGRFKFGRNQFDLFRTEDVKLIRELAAKMNINTSSYIPHILDVDGIRLFVKNRNDELERSKTYIFLHKEIIFKDREMLEKHVNIARRQKIGNKVSSLLTMPSRESILR